MSRDEMICRAYQEYRRIAMSEGAPEGYIEVWRDLAASQRHAWAAAVGSVLDAVADEMLQEALGEERSDKEGGLAC